MFKRKGRAAVWKVREDWVLCIHQSLLMRAVSRDGDKRKSSGNGAGVIPAETDLKEEVEASMFFSSGCSREN